MSQVATLCPNCFSRKVTSTTCPDCGQSVVLPQNTLIMTPGAMLSDRYLLGRLVGQGGFGATYLGMDEKLSVRTAVKEYLPYGCVSRATDGKTLIVNPSASENYQFGLSRFLDEARMLARLRGCRNVVSVFDFFEENGSAYIVMEFLQGVTLKDLIKGADNGRVPPPRALTILDAMLNALTEIHACDILHRDISPDNVMVAQGDTVKLLDFGAARQAMSGHSQKMSVILKPGYAPFEQYLEGGNQGPWSDVYAVAATFYHAVTGTKPPDALQRMSQESLRRPSELGVALPSALETALMKALALKADNRYRSAAEFKADIGPAARPAALKLPPIRSAGAVQADAINRAAPQPASVRAASALVADALVTRTAMAAPGEFGGLGSSGIDVERALRERVAAEREDVDLFDGKPISPIELAKLVQDHQRFLKGQSKGKRLDLAFRRLSGMSLPRLNLQDSQLRGVLLRNCDLSGTDLGGADLFCADLTGARLIGANLTKADLRGTKFEGANLTDAVLDDADCREGILLVQQNGGALLDVHKERDARAASFAGAVLQRSSFRAAELGGVDFRKATAIETRFDKANLRDANFNETRVAKAVFAGADLEGAEFTMATMVQVDLSAPEFAKARVVRHLDDIETELKAKIIDHQLWVDTLSKGGKRLVMRDCDLSGLQMRGVNWSAAEFHNVDFHDVVLTEAKLSMANFLNCRMSNADLSGAEACGANFTGCGLAGANLAGADFSTVTSINDSKTRWRASFKNTDLTRAVLNGAKLTESRMVGANLSGASLAGAAMTGVDLSKAKLTGADFTGADTTGAILTDAEVTGTRGLAKK